MDEGLRVEYINAVKEKFAAPFAKVKWRVGATNKKQGAEARGIALAYIDARDVMRRLDEVVGFDGWSTQLVCVHTSWICTLSIILPSVDGSYHWVSKTDAADATDIEASKGGASDALKRAAVQWGIGQYLYELKAPWVALKGKAIDPKELERLNRLLPGAAEHGGGQEERVDQLLDDDGKKELYSANFKGMEALGYDRNAVDDLANPEKFKVLNAGLKALGLRAVNQVREEQKGDVLDAMRWYLREQLDAKQAAHDLENDHLDPEKN